MSKKEIQIMRTITLNCIRRETEAEENNISLSSIDRLLMYLVEANELLSRNDHLKINIESNHSLVNIVNKDNNIITSKKIKGAIIDCIDEEFDSIITSYLEKITY